jgi:hypothetical protein
MLDSDLAELYGVEPRRLRKQVKRNMERFPAHFMFQLTEDEVVGMVSQIVIPFYQLSFKFAVKKSLSWFSPV